MAAAIALLGFYASSLSRSLLQALPAGVCPAVLMFLAVAVSAKCAPGVSSVMWRWDNLLFPAMAVPVLSITLIWLSYRNYLQLRTGWALSMDNLVRGTVVVACLMTVSLGIFNRDWELFMRLEPQHGPARISGSGRTELSVGWPGVERQMGVKGQQFVYGHRYWITGFIAGWAALAGNGELFLEQRPIYSGIHRQRHRWIRRQVQLGPSGVGQPAPAARHPVRRNALENSRSVKRNPNWLGLGLESRFRLQRRLSFAQAKRNALGIGRHGPNASTIGRLFPQTSSSSGGEQLFCRIDPGFVGTSVAAATHRP